MNLIFNKSAILYFGVLVAALLLVSFLINLGIIY